MNSFQENACRLCFKIFCCVKCRSYHEEEIHEINSECEICIYGRMTIKNASLTLLNHIKAKHWPLHCVFCKKVFNTVDELLPHEKCPINIERMKKVETPKTPATPVTENKDLSPMVTPFYKSNNPGMPQMSSITMAITSTPLQRDDNNIKITPSDASDIRSICKSSLKLTRSSNLSDSKKSERRVTFSETPSLNEHHGKSGEQEIIKEQLEESTHNNETNADAVDDFYVSVKDENTSEEDKENSDNKLVICSKSITQSDVTNWESALTNLGLDISNKSECINTSVNQINVSLKINVFNETLKSNESSLLKSCNGNDTASVNKSTNIWSSMTSIVKSVLNLSAVSIKRSKPDSDSPSDMPSYKRMKLTELKCRRPIRHVSPLYQIPLARPKYVDKATQTDEIWI